MYKFELVIGVIALFTLLALTVQAVEREGLPDETWAIEVVEVRGVLARMPKIAGGGFRLVHAFMVSRLPAIEGGGFSLKPIGGKYGVPIVFPSDKAARHCEDLMMLEVKVMGLRGLNGEGASGVLASQPLAELNADEKLPELSEEQE